MLGRVPCLAIARELPATTSWVQALKPFSWGVFHPSFVVSSRCSPSTSSVILRTKVLPERFTRDLCALSLPGKGSGFNGAIQVCDSSFSSPPPGSLPALDGAARHQRRLQAQSYTKFQPQACSILRQCQAKLRIGRLLKGSLASF